MITKRWVGMLTAGMTLLLATGCAGQTTVQIVSASGSGSSSTPSTAATAANGLVPYRGDRFTVSMPGTPDLATQQASTGVGQIPYIQLTVTKGDSTFAVGYLDYPTGSRLNLNSAARGSASAAKGQLTDVKQVTVKNAPALDFRVKAEEFTVFSRDLVSGSRIYELFVLVPGKDVKTPPKEYLSMRDSLVF